MNRRRFIGLLGLATAGTALGLDPLRQLVEPGLRRHFLLHGTPEAGGVTALAPDVPVYEWAPEHFSGGLQFFADQVLAGLELRLGAPRYGRVLITDQTRRLGDAVRVRRPVSLAEYYAVPPEHASRDITDLAFRVVPLDRQVGCDTLVSRVEARNSRQEDLWRALAAPMAAALAKHMGGWSAVAIPPLIPGGAEVVAAANERSGLALRAVRQWDHVRGAHAIRVDMLGGV